MKDKTQYIFRSGELFLLEDSTLPCEIPTGFSPCVVDSLELELGGKPAVAVLLEDVASKHEVVSASVGNAPVCELDGSGPAGNWIRLRHIMASSEPAIASIAPSATKALGLINWHHATRFCSRCGAPLSDHDKELARLCPACSSVFFPRISPAIIVLVEKDGKILLARHSYRNQDMFSCIAGFLEHGETLEQCVAREVFEEIHLEIQNIRYVGSQSWPFPDQYMLAFRADWKAGEICVDPSEILEARWFDRDNLPNTPMAGTVAWNLIYGVFDTSSKK